MSHDALSFIERLPAKQYRQVVHRVLGLLSDPSPADSKRLVGFSYFRVDQGEFRIIYAYDSDTVSVVLIGKRNDDDVYRRLSRR